MRKYYKYYIYFYETGVGNTTDITSLKGPNTTIRHLSYPAVRLTGPKAGNQDYMRATRRRRRTQRTSILALKKNICMIKLHRKLRH